MEYCSGIDATSSLGNFSTVANFMKDGTDVMHDGVAANSAFMTGFICLALLKGLGLCWSRV